MKTATVFDIERSSYVDGPGIRTTVFFKGCNLRCAWCHNPESQAGGREMLFYKNKCTGCGKCKEKCPSGAISGKSWTYNREDFFSAAKCSEFMKREYKNIGRGAVCGLCVKYCPYGK